MSDERFSSLEAAFRDLREEFRERSQRREDQLGSLATSLVSQKGGIDALNFRLEKLEGLKPLSLVQVISPSVAVFGLLTVVGGAFLTLMQREQEAKFDVVDARIEIGTERQRALDTRLNVQVGELNKISERQFGMVEKVAGEQGKVHQMEKQLESVDVHGSRKWVNGK